MSSRKIRKKHEIKFHDQFLTIEIKLITSVIFLFLYSMYDLNVHV